ncbi:hypothetical protein A374_11280 [Fictibacillus macauensis ZFHKF-1]|uniref:Aminoglycoside phosphotransferase domain-containing protein n=1 Tax=Fictibacillus macauensis ZFHKF-1 TaxID=1196324 RepID=I8AHW4_9BACL|nr:phosphotransferase [Fictibacillus macauensis]EIT85322.1 hypothetical protein A374_11280 [Fictibacillus macauensis ZFHKF-1]
MRTNGNQEGFKKNRGFLESLTEKGLDIKNYYFVKYNVCIIETKAGNFVLKGFSKERDYYEQLKLSRWYSKQNHPMMAVYISYPSGSKVHHYDGMYWCMMPFYNGKELDLNDETDVREGLHTILKFHEQSVISSEKYHSVLSTYSLLKKWNKRLNAFKKNVQQQSYPESLKPAFEEMLSWGKWALHHLDKKEIDLLENAARKRGEVCHGDVAPHNFMRLDEQEIILIDYDLFSVVPHEYDVLQYVNRIMPYWQWSPYILRQCKSHYLEQLMQKKWFLTALVFPTDLYREWNRAFEGGREKIREMIAFTDSDLPTRRAYIQALQSQIMHHS